MKRHLLKNNKGFVLVESIVVAIFVLGFLTFLAVNILPLVGNYEAAINNDNVESRYEAHLIRKMLLKDNFCNSSSLLKMSSKTIYNHFVDDQICDYLENKRYCRELFSEKYLNVKEILIIDSSAQDIKNLTKAEYSTIGTDVKEYTEYVDTVSREMREYIKNMSTFEPLDPFSYPNQNRMVIRFGDGSITNVLIILEGDGASCGGFEC